MGHKWVICRSHPDCSVGQWVKWVNRCDPLSTLSHIAKAESYISILHYIKPPVKYTHLYSLGSYTKEKSNSAIEMVATKKRLVKHLCIIIMHTSPAAACMLIVSQACYNLYTGHFRSEKIVK